MTCLLFCKWKFLTACSLFQTETAFFIRNLFFLFVEIHIILVNRSMRLGCAESVDIEIGKSVDK